MLFFALNEAIALRMIGCGWKRLNGLRLYWPDDEMPRA